MPLTSKKRCPICSHKLMYNGNGRYKNVNNLHCDIAIPENDDGLAGYQGRHYETFLSEYNSKIEIINLYPLKITVSHMKDCSYRHFRIEVYKKYRYEDVVSKFGKWETDKKLKKKFMTYITFS